MLPAGIAGTPKIDEIKADFEIYNKPKNDWSAIRITPGKATLRRMPGTELPVASG